MRRAELWRFESRGQIGYDVALVTGRWGLLRDKVVAEPGEAMNGVARRSTRSGRASGAIRKFAWLTAGGNRIRTIGPALVKGLWAVADERCRTDKLDGVIKHRSSRETTMVGRGASLGRPSLSRRDRWFESGSLPAENPRLTYQRRQRAARRNVQSRRSRCSSAAAQVVRSGIIAPGEAEQFPLRAGEPTLRGDAAEPTRQLAVILTSVSRPPVPICGDVLWRGSARRRHRRHSAGDFLSKTSDSG